MQKVKTSHRKYPFLKEDVYTGSHSQPIPRNRKETHPRYHIRNMSKKSISVVVVTDTHGVTESDISKHTDKVDEPETRSPPTHDPTRCETSSLPDHLVTELSRVRDEECNLELSTLKVMENQCISVYV